MVQGSRELAFSRFSTLQLFVGLTEELSQNPSEDKLFCFGFATFVNDVACEGHMFPTDIYGYR